MPRWNWTDGNFWGRIGLPFAAASALLALAGCTPGAQGPPTRIGATPEVWLALPRPRTSGPLSLEEALARRRSIREYDEQPLTLVELSQLLWAAQGVTGPAGLRTAPSAGALYPLELYAVTPEATYHYAPGDHALRLVTAGDRRLRLWQAALRQDSVRDAPAVFVIAAVYARPEQKYGAERTPRYVHLEAGHAAQNLLLQAIALDLGAVPIGAFDDAGVQAALSLPADHRPLYLIPVGHPRP